MSIFSDKEVQIMNQEYRLYDIDNRKRGFFFTLAGVGRSRDFRNKVEDIFYSIKALICIFLRRRKSSWSYAEVTIFDWHQSTSSADWMTVSVGWGILSDWYYDIFEDGNN